MIVRIDVKWEKPPLWPVAIPSLLGFLMACSPLREHKFEALIFISTAEGQDSLITPLLGMILMTSLVHFAPQEIGNRFELASGAIAALLFGMIPQAFLFPWMIVVVLLWISQSIYVWRRSYPPFRIGIWLGLGGASGLFIGGFFANYFL